jgi:mRNA interferase RelE/StbE
VPSYRVVFTASAERELKKLPSDVITRILSRIQSLASNPCPAGCKKLQGGDREWRIRVGDYRVVYTIDDRKLQIEVTRIRHRREAYQR